MSWQKSLTPQQVERIELAVDTLASNGNFVAMAVKTVIGKQNQDQKRATFALLFSQAFEFL